MLFIVSATLLVSGAIQYTAVAYQDSEQKQGYPDHDKMMMKPGSYVLGTIASLQNDKNGNPTWIVSGLYKGSLSMNNKTQDGAVTGSLPNATLNSKFSMVMTNGSAMHDHRSMTLNLQICRCQITRQQYLMELLL